MSVTEPFLKWAGGKRSTAIQIIQFIPELSPNATYFEPFLGGGAIFFAMQPAKAWLSDANNELVNTYVAVKEDVDQVITHLSRFTYSEKEYYKIRSSTPADKFKAAARFIYLNKTCFNGLYRVNKRGEFNVPFGRHGPNLLVCDEEQLRNASRALVGATITAEDFESVLVHAKAGDVVYCDPPYTRAHSNNGFIEYNAKVFSWDDRRRLSRVAVELVKRGVFVAISNANHESIANCYSESTSFQVHEIERWSTIAGKAAKRFLTSELILVGKSPTET